MNAIALVEDDEKAVAICKSYLSRYQKETGESFKLFRFSDGAAFLKGYKSIYDVVFMDIEMPNLDGLEASKRLRSIDSFVPLVFMTNMAQYAIKGYEVNALDYIVKPVGYFTFIAKLNKALAYKKKYADREVTINKRDGMIRLETSQIYYIEVMNHSLIYHTDKGDIEATGSLSKAEDTLKKNHFSRCNNCYLINLFYVTAVKEEEVVVNETRLKISRSKKKSFLNDLIGFQGGAF